MSNTIQVPREEVERLIRLLRYTTHPMPSPHAEHWEALLKAAPASTGAEPVAWMYEGRTTANSAVLDDWLRSGFQVTPLYTQPPAQDEAVLVPRTVFDRISKFVGKYSGKESDRINHELVALVQRGEAPNNG